MPWSAWFRNIPRGDRSFTGTNGRHPLPVPRVTGLWAGGSHAVGHARVASAACSQQVIHRQLVEALEGHPARGGRLDVEVLERRAVRE